MLLNTFSASGNSNPQPYAGGPGSFWAFGNLGGGVLQLQWRPAGSTNTANWINIPGVTISDTTNAPVINFAVSAGALRAVLSGATTPSVDCGAGAFLGEGVRQG